MSVLKFNLSRLTIDPEVAANNNKIHLVRPNYSKAEIENESEELLWTGISKMTPTKRMLIKGLLKKTNGVTIDKNIAKAIDEILHGEKISI